MTLQDVMTAAGATLKAVLGTDISPECLAEQATLIGTCRNTDVYLLECGDYYAECADGAGSSHGVTVDDLVDAGLASINTRAMAEQVDNYLRTGNVEGEKR